ncbi:uncharacterized protein LOC130815271 [Amaranthus tricolor]|uniref:uncharacterized protein LOC130815271 n=1 Tax=Amaranthus tricolor TaxID=29722 RepID=UPI002590ADFC|nr:uncharacterized protein LOC130815271 [Amaranthus tricolor]
MANLQLVSLDCRSICTFSAPILPPITSSHHSLFKVVITSENWGKKDTSLRKIWLNKKLLGVKILAPRSSGNSSSNEPLEDSSTQDKVPFGYTRKDVLLIGVGVTVFGVALKSGLEFAGVDPLQAGNVVQLLVVLGMTVGWIFSYMFRVANKDMTYAQQLRDYESKVMEKRLEGLTEAELQVLLEQVEEEKRSVGKGEQVN